MAASCHLPVGPDTVDPIMASPAVHTPVRDPNLDAAQTLKILEQRLPPELALEIMDLAQIWTLKMFLHPTHPLTSAGPAQPHAPVRFLRGPRIRRLVYRVALTWQPRAPRHAGDCHAHFAADVGGCRALSGFEMARSEADRMWGDAQSAAPVAPVHAEPYHFHIVMERGEGLAAGERTWWAKIRKGADLQIWRLSQTCGCWQLQGSCIEFWSSV